MSTVLCLLAHPDDEVFCAGLLGQLSERGVQLHLTYLTRGEGGITPVLRGKGRADIAAIRGEEALCSARVLGAQVTFLDYVDPAPGEELRAPAHNPEQLVQDVRTLIEEVAPTFVLTHGSNGDYGHPAHILLHTVTRRAIRAIGPSSPPLYSFNAFHPSLPHPGRLNDDDWADVVVDVSPALATKHQVLECHRTQWSVFIGHHESPRDLQSALTEYVRTSSLEGYCQHLPGGNSAAQTPLFDWLESDSGLSFVYTARSVTDHLRRRKHRGQLRLARGLRSARTYLSSVWKQARSTGL